MRNNKKILKKSKIKRKILKKLEKYALWKELKIWKNNKKIKKIIIEINENSKIEKIID